MIIIRLWHEKLIPKLSDRHLLGQHRECAALRGNGWGKKHTTVDYVFTHSYAMLFEYHKRVMEEMIKRGFKISYEWTVSQYRGKNCESATYEFYMENHSYMNGRDTIYPEHDDAYMEECLMNLERKGFKIEI